MAPLRAINVKKTQARNELRAFKALLDGKGAGDLGEKEDLLPFFDSHEQLCALMGTYNSEIIHYRPVSIAREFSIFGDHRADLVIGDIQCGRVCFIELEDATFRSFFRILLFILHLYFLTFWYCTTLNCIVLQGEDIVVVIGMLHCNGVARWLLSGVDPLKFISSQSKF